jgi:hypothetical protein
VIHLNVEAESEQVPREFYAIVGNLSEQLAESGVPQRRIDRALDKIERAIVRALGYAEEESDDDEDSDDEDDERDDEEPREG